MSPPDGSVAGRPTFFEGQIVGASDLNGVVDGARVSLAQHERYLHLPGIAEGLEMIGSDRQTLAGDGYKDIVVQPGLAVDGTGRHLVLTQAQRLSEDAFDQLNIAINDPLAYYPVFLRGRDEAGGNAGSPLVACASTEPTRVQEVADIAFGRVEDAVDPGNTPVTDVGAGPSGTSAGKPWSVLLGFVQWNAAIKRFAATTDSHDGIGRDYAGVRADEVVSRSGYLALRSAAKGTNGTPVVEIDAKAGELRFGAQSSSGSVVPVLTVTAKGDLTVTGKISGAIAKGVQIQTGSASDGMLLPLPPGITQAQIDAGTVTIQSHVSPHYGVPALPNLAAGDFWLMTPLECRVDDRRVLCRVRWTASGGAPAPRELPGVCDYTVMAFSAA